MRDECPICGAAYLTAGQKLTRELHYAHASRRMKAARRDPQLLQHIRRLDWNGEYFGR